MLFCTRAVDPSISPCLFSGRRLFKIALKCKPSSNCACAVLTANNNGWLVSRSLAHNYGTHRACAVLELFNTPLFTPFNARLLVKIPTFRKDFKISVKIFRDLTEDFQDFTRISGFLRDFKISREISRFLQRLILRRQTR